METLKPCPFCGNEACERYRDNWSGAVGIGCSSKKCLLNPCVEHTSPAIPNGDGSTSHWNWNLNKLEAIKAWNTRAKETT